MNTLAGCQLWNRNPAHAAATAIPTGAGPAPPRHRRQTKPGHHALHPCKPIDSVEEIENVHHTDDPQDGQGPRQKPERDIKRGRQRDALQRAEPLNYRSQLPRSPRAAANLPASPPEIVGPTERGHQPKADDDLPAGKRQPKGRRDCQPSREARDDADATSARHRRIVRRPRVGNVQHPLPPEDRHEDQKRSPAHSRCRESNQK